MNKLDDIDHNMICTDLGVGSEQTREREVPTPQLQAEDYIRVTVTSNSEKKETAITQQPLTQMR